MPVVFENHATQLLRSGNMQAAVRLAAALNNGPLDVGSTKTGYRLSREKGRRRLFRLVGVALCSLKQSEAQFDTIIGSQCPPDEFGQKQCRLAEFADNLGLSWHRALRQKKRANFPVETAPNRAATCAI